MVGLRPILRLTAVSLLAEYKPGRNLQTNVEFYTALLLHGLGLSTALFTPTFAVGRAAGWLGHCFEQKENGRLIRPQPGSLQPFCPPLICPETAVYGNRDDELVLRLGGNQADEAVHRLLQFRQ